MTNVGMGKKNRENFVSSDDLNINDHHADKGTSAIIRCLKITSSTDKHCKEPQRISATDDCNSIPGDPIPDEEVKPTVHIIEDDPVLCEAGQDVFESAGFDVVTYRSAEAFLRAERPTGDACLIVDMMLPGVTGLTLIERLQAEGSDLPAIMLTGADDAKTAVAAFKAGVLDFVEKPANPSSLIASVFEAITQARFQRSQEEARADASRRFNSLTPREKDVVLLILNGEPNKNIASDLGISQRTVEYHRASVMRKTGARSMPDLTQLFILANGSF